MLCKQVSIDKGAVLKVMIGKYVVMIRWLVWYRLQITKGS